ncbi:extracellular solute-binding protein [Paenibacillus sp. HB172176]|uniref:extracellular solute-binding protein n=1 Tax=Paenibacillus sp. HB172176 TaxID=2493690 RepID=UPI00143875C3|nr:extracellular solute-binding protein [Paenibacillus sp. HB172176]
MKSKPFVTTILATFLASAAVLTGCSNNGGESAKGTTEPTQAAQNGSQNAGGEDAKSQEPIEITTLEPYWGDMPDVDGKMFQQFEEAMNAKLEPTFVNGPSMMDKVNVALASGDLPDILVVFQGSQPPIVNAIRAGAFWEVGKYVDQFPNLKASRSELRDSNIAVDGKIWALYDSAAISRLGFSARKDWLDRLGRDIPTTMDELYDMLKAFTEEDPDGNGKADTLGLATYLNNNLIEGFDAVASKFGAPNVYKVDNGTFIPAFTTSEYRDALKFYRDLYANNIMNKDFTYAKRAQVEEMYQKGQVGLLTGNVDSVWEPLVKANPEAEIKAWSEMQGPNLTFAGLGYWSTLMFPKSAVKTEEELLSILGALDALASPDYEELRLFGAEGENYTLENGKHVIINAKGLNGMNVLALTPPEFSDEGKLAWAIDANKVVQSNESAPNLVGNPANGLISDTWSKMGNQLQQLQIDTDVKYIMGEVDDAGYDDMIKQWMDKGGQSVLDEYAAAYKNK